MLPFGLNIAPRVFTKITRTVAVLLVDEGVQVLMYLDDWLVQGMSEEEARTATATTLSVCRDLGFRFNIPKSLLSPTQTITWLGMRWDAQASTLSLLDDNRERVLAKLRRTVVAVNCNHKLWASLLGSLNYAAQVVPLGRLWCRRLWWEGNRLFPRTSPYHLRPVPHHIHHLLYRWLTPGLLQLTVPWRTPTPQLSVYTDASDTGWGYQASSGLQGRGLWSPKDKKRHVNVRELMVPHIFIRQQVHLNQMHICFHMDNVVAVQCIKRMGSSRSLPLLQASEHLFHMAASRHLTLTAVHVPGRDNVWADALSRSETSSVEWSLDPDAFTDLIDLYGLPDVDLFASALNHRLPLYITRTTVTPAGGPDALLEDWNRWEYIYLFPPPAAAVMTAVCGKLETYKGRVLLVAPLWKAQPWCQRLLRWCPHPLPLNRLAVTGHGILQSGMSSDFHAWSFCRNA